MQSEHKMLTVACRLSQKKSNLKERWFGAERNMSLSFLSREYMCGISTLQKMFSKLGNILAAVILKVFKIEVTLRDGVILRTQTSSHGDLMLLVSIETR